MDASDLAEPFSVSAAAAARIRKVLSSEAEGAILRVAVDGGGCSGFQYSFKVVAAAEPGDIVIRRDGATVVVDAVSLDFLRGAEVDFVDDLIGQSFKIHNPNAVASCGCGTSFAV